VKNYKPQWYQEPNQNLVEMYTPQWYQEPNQNLVEIYTPQWYQEPYQNLVEMYTPQWYQEPNQNRVESYTPQWYQEPNKNFVRYGIAFFGMFSSNLCSYWLLISSQNLHNYYQQTCRYRSFMMDVNHCGLRLFKKED